MNERTAMQTTAVYSCVRILSEAVASLPIHVYRYTDTGKERGNDYAQVIRDGNGHAIIYCESSVKWQNDVQVGMNK